MRDDLPRRSPSTSPNRSLVTSTTQESPNKSPEPVRKPADGYLETATNASDNASRCNFFFFFSSLPPRRHRQHPRCSTSNRSHKCFSINCDTFILSFAYHVLQADKIPSIPVPIFEWDYIWIDVIARLGSLLRQF